MQLLAVSPGVTTVRTRHGLVFRTRTATDRRTIESSLLQQPLGRTLAATLEQIGRDYGPATADFVALQLEYDRR